MSSKGNCTNNLCLSFTEVQNVLRACAKINNNKPFFLELEGNSIIKYVLILKL